MKTSELLSAPSLRIFEWATNTSEADLLRIILNAALFIDPDRVRQVPVMSPDCVRKSNQWHPGKQKGETSSWNGLPVQVCDNTQARVAFGKYIDRKMGGRDRNVSVGWEVAHVWGRVFDPDYFTAGWNMVLIPGFLRVLTEEQAQSPLFSRCIQALAYRLFFKSNPVAAPTVLPELDSATELPSWLSDFSPRILRAAELKPKVTVDIDALPEHLRKHAQNL